MTTARKRTRDPLQKWVDHRDRPALLFLVEDGPISETHLLQVELATRHMEHSELDLVIKSPGGNPHVAFRIISLLRRRLAILNGVIPETALSAATLMAIACDSLAFSSGGHLGPLDMQESGWNEKGLRERRSVALKPAAIEQALDVAIDVCKYFIDEFPDTQEASQAFRLAAEVGYRMATPLLSGATLQSLGQSSRALRMGEDYANEVLQLRANVTGRDIRAIAHDLVHRYSDHAFVIDEEQCRDLGLPVRSLDAAEARLIEELAFMLRSSDRPRPADIRVVQPSIPTPRTPADARGSSSPVQSRPKAASRAKSAKRPAKQAKTRKGSAR